MNTIKKNFFFNLVLTLSNVVFPIVTFPYASRILGPEGIGKVQFVTNYAMYFVLIAALGIPAYGIREVAKFKTSEVELKQIFTELVTINFATSLLMFLIYSTFVIAIPSLSIDRDFYIVAVFMLLLGCCNVDWLFSGLEAFRFIAIRSVLIKALGMLALFFLVKTKNDALYYLGITVGSVVLNNLWNVWTARHYFDWSTLVVKQIRRHIRPLLYIFSTVAAISVYTILDTIILGFFAGYEAVGYYTAASRIIKITIPILTSLGTVMIPQLAQAFKEKDFDHIRGLYKHSLDFVILLGIPMTIGLIVLAPELIFLFSGKEFTSAILPMQLFAPVILVIGLSNIWSVQILMPSGNDKYVTVSVVLGLVASLILNFSLIPHFEYIGATVANLVSELVVMGGLIYYSSKIVRIDFNIKLAFSTLMISLLFWPISIWFRRLFEFDHIFMCVFTMAFCGSVYILLQVIVVKNQLVLGQLKKLKAKFN